MSELRYAIGATVWLATFDSETRRVTCSHCGGTGRLRVTFHDETQVSIGCQNCQRGFEPPSGYVEHYERIPRAKLATITGAEINGERIEWRVHSTHDDIVPDDRLFNDEAAALTKAQQMAAEENAEALARIANKEKDTRSWAWNASYHRKEIKRCRESIAYHESKLAVAAIKANENTDAK